MKRHVRRRRTVLVMLFALIWMQLALAAYACPSLSLPALTAASSMTDCEGMAPGMSMADPQNPALCLQHALQGDQHSDGGHGIAVPPLPDVVLAVAWLDRNPRVATVRTALERDLARSLSPPKSIVHCCFRI
jgi:hypothetical protein